MDKFDITATMDIPNEAIIELKNDIGHKKCYEHSNRRALNSTEPPSFIEIVGSLITWKTIFIGSATVFFSTLTKKLAEDIYDKKSVIAESLFKPVRALSKAIVKFTLSSPNKNTFVRIELKAPRGLPNPALILHRETEEEITFQLSCFYSVSDKIYEYLLEIQEQNMEFISPPIILVLANGNVKISFFAGYEQCKIEHIFKLEE